MLDIEDAFRYNKIEGGMDKKAFTSDVKGGLNRPWQGNLIPIFIVL